MYPKAHGNKFYGSTMLFDVQKMLPALRKERKDALEKIKKLDALISNPGSYLEVREPRAFPGCDIPSMVDLAREFLLEKKRTCTTHEITNFLIERGIKSRSKKFIDNVGAVLRRNKKGIVRAGPGKWRLQDFNE